MSETTFETDLTGKIEIPTLTHELVAAISDHIEEATKNPQPILDPEDEDMARWHDGEEIYLRLTDETVAAIRENNGYVPLLYFKRVETDHIGDIIVVAGLPA